jgi:aspartyl-tRNA(Asn)/glutamyl-tRNA(Gln) amidotransferase subunit B
MGFACHCSISSYNIFDRKNYFYPDLPKGYQTTQDRHPVCKGGYVMVKTKNGNVTRIRLNRIHMEEDAGKSVHPDGHEGTWVDLNRAGVPLIEIVSEPDIRDSEEAYVYLAEIRRLVRYLEICDGNMEEGSLRCDANVSVRLKGSHVLGKKVEVKNMNSLRNVQRAIDHEKLRQIQLLEKGLSVISETRLFDADKGTTYPMRTKEELNDYRYFPDPDLPPVIVSEKTLENIRNSLPTLPEVYFLKFTNTFGLPEYDVTVLTDSREVAVYFDALCGLTQNYKAASNWVMTQVKGYLNEKGCSMAEFPLSPDCLAEVIGLVDQGLLSHTAASGPLFQALLRKPGANPRALAQAENLIQDSSDDFIQPLIAEVLRKFPDKVKDYQKGKKNLLGLFMGEVMKLGKGKVDPQKASLLIKKELEKN